jgi:hypothetical protein
MNPNYKFAQDEVVHYTIADIKGLARIKGVTQEVAVLGMIYILEPISGFSKSDVYPFTHISCPEVWLKKLNT